MLGQKPACFKLYGSQMTLPKRCQFSLQSILFENAHFSTLASCILKNGVPIRVIVSRFLNCLDPNGCQPVYLRLNFMVTCVYFSWIGWENFCLFSLSVGLPLSHSFYMYSWSLQFTTIQMWPKKPLRKMPFACHTSGKTIKK